MTRKMAWIGSFYLTGLFLASFLGYAANLAAASVLILIAVPALIVYGKRRVKAAVCLISAAAGMFLYGAYDIGVYRNTVKYDGCGVEIVGVITDCSDYSGDKSSYTVKGVINGDAAAKVTCFTDSAFAEPGDKVKLTGKAAVLKDSYTFPANSYYKAKGIFLQINNVTGFEVTAGGFSFRKMVNKYRGYILEVIFDNMDRDCAGVMSAMLFGDKSAVDSYEKTLMYRAGIGHIMAVSGVHLSVVCSFFWFILSRLPINKYLRFGLLLVPIACFVLLAGMSNSVLRAAVMIILVYGAGLFRRRADTFNSLGIAVILLTVRSPFAVRDASFLLSAAGVFGIGVAGPAFVENIRNGRQMNGAVKTLLLSFCVMVTVFPVSILFFDEVSVISPLSNLLLLPICEIILIGGVIVTLTGGAAFAAVPVLKVCGICCRAVIEASEFIGGLGFSYIPLGSVYVRIIFLAALAAVILSAVLLRNSKITAELSVAILAGAISLTSLYRALPDDRVTVAVLKDGNAVSAVVHDKSSACIVDLYKGGMAVDPVVKYLNRNGISDIDAVILNADVNYSFPVYIDRLRLFDIGMLLVPEEDKALTAGIAEDSLSYYRNNNGCVEMDDYSLCFLSDGVVTVTAGEAEIIMYGSEAVTAGEDTYSAAVRYSGKDAGSDPESSVIAVMNDKAEVTVSKDKTVYIGENVRFVIEPNGKVKPEKIK